MRGMASGLLLSVLLAVSLVAKDVTPQVVIKCDCLKDYPAWLCQVFWWALC